MISNVRARLVLELVGKGKVNPTTPSLVTENRVECKSYNEPNIRLFVSGV